MGKFELNRLAEYTDEAILNEIKRVAAAFPKVKFTQAFFEKHSRVARTTILRRFGSWDRAMAAAQLEHRLTSNPLARLSDQEVLETLRKLAATRGKDQLTIREVQECFGLDATTFFQRRWGSSRAAFEAAGLKVSPVGRRYTDEECFENLLDVWTYYGRPPEYREMGASPSRVGGKAYVKRFGTWRKALTAFAERMESDATAMPIGSESDSQSNGGEDTIKEEVREYGRDIPLSLRYKILRRDFFKCVLCGDNPPRSSDCVLHVDHILPWSKGGKTIEENLRTLCANCNLGRSNRYSD